MGLSPPIPGINLELQKQLVLSCPWIKGTEENLPIERPGNPVRESLWTVSPNPSRLSFFPFLSLSLSQEFMHSDLSQKHHQKRARDLLLIVF